MKKKLITCLFCFSLLACTNSQPIDIEPTESPEIVEEPSYAVLETIQNDEESIVPFNTPIKLETLTKEDMGILEYPFQKTLKEYGKLFDSYHSYEGMNNIYTINESYATNKAIPIDEELFTLIQEGIKLTKLTEGKFNITIGPLFRVWKDLFSPFPIEANDPDANLIQEAQACVVPYKDIEKVIELNEEDSSITLHEYPSCKNKVILDLGAIAKGYAVDQTAEELSKEDKPFLINAGASSIIAYTPKNDTHDWYIGIRDPYARIFTLYDYRLENTGTFTSSGDDSNYFILQTEDGPIIRHHILNPLTGYPENNIKAATVQGSHNAMVSDALTTALFNCKDDTERISLIQKIEKEYQLDLAYSWFIQTGNEKGKLMVSEDFHKQIIEESISDHVEKVEVIK